MFLMMRHIIVLLSVFLYFTILCTLFYCFFCFICLRIPRSTLFPYTTLFRSRPRRGRGSAPDRTRCCADCPACAARPWPARRDRKSTRLNSSHVKISYAVFCL